jgi:hypothetical protein
MKDVVSLAALVLGFAALVTVHVTIVVGLARRAGVGRAATAFFVPVLAPYWAARQRMGLRAALWIASLAVYATGWILDR